MNESNDFAAATTNRQIRGCCGQASPTAIHNKERASLLTSIVDARHFLQQTSDTKQRSLGLGSSQHSSPIYCTYHTGRVTFPRGGFGGL